MPTASCSGIVCTNAEPGWPSKGQTTLALAGRIKLVLTSRMAALVPSVTSRATASLKDFESHSTVTPRSHKASPGAAGDGAAGDMAAGDGAAGDRVSEDPPAGEISVMVGEFLGALIFYFFWRSKFPGKNIRMFTSWAPSLVRLR